MRAILAVVLQLCLCLRPHPSLAGEGRLRCSELDLKAAHSKFLELANSLYPESRDRIAGWVEKAKADSDPQSACETLTLARDALARIHGPRIIDSQKPDPKIYPKRLSRCSHPKSVHKKLEAFMKRSETDLYPKARIQVRALLREADKLSSKDENAACTLYDELRNYLLELWPHRAS